MNKAHSIYNIPANSPFANALGQDIITYILPPIEEILRQIEEGTFPFELYAFSKKTDQSSNKTGLYLIINRKTKHIYIGSTGNIGQRKGEHNLNLKNAARNGKLCPTMRTDLNTGQPSDFVFMALLYVIGDLPCDLVEQNKVSTAEKPVTLAQFVETFVESPLIEFLGTKYPGMVYNVKSGGLFTEGNSFGGSYNSGAARVFVKISLEGLSTDYAWESITGAADSLGVARKSVGNLLRNNKGFREIKPEQYASFNGICIKDPLAKTFFEKGTEMNKADHHLILRTLFPRSNANKALGNGEQSNANKALGNGEP